MRHEEAKRNNEFTDSHDIVASFKYDGHIYFLYHRNEVDSQVYITGHALDWEPGLKYDPTVKHIIRTQYITDELRDKIIKAME